MAKPHREGIAPNLESSSKGEAWHSDMAQKGQTELHIEADAADGHGGGGAPGGGSWMGFCMALCTEGHTAWDCLLTVACAQVGQVMLVMPHSMALMGVRNGIVIAGIAALGGLWTMFLLAALYVEMKTRSIRQGTWYDASGKRRRATQYHEVMGYWGGPWLKYLAQALVAVHLIGTCTAQIVACSGNNYAIMPQRNKRFYALVWGVVLVSASLLPTFRHFRLLNIFALLGMSYTGEGLSILAAPAAGDAFRTHAAWYIVGASASHGVSTAPFQRTYKSWEDFFLGSAVLGQYGHSVALEMADAMRNSGHFQLAYTGGWVYVLTLIFPHSITSNLAFPDQVYQQDNIYSVLPPSRLKEASVWLMNIHQVVSFAIYCIPLLYMWEKLIGIHSKPAYIRLPLRLPISCFIWFLAIAFPFYGTLNALYAAFSEPWVAFILPSLVHTVVFRREASRRSAALKPFRCLRIGNWAPVFFINMSIVVLWSVFQFGFGLFFAVKRLVTNVTDFGVFAACYQCETSFAAN